MVSLNSTHAFTTALEQLYTHNYIPNYIPTSTLPTHSHTFTPCTILLYCASLLCLHALIEGVQKFALRMVFGAWGASYHHLLFISNQLTLEDRRMVMKLSVLYQILVGSWHFQPGFTTNLSVGLDRLCFFYALLCYSPMLMVYPYYAFKFAYYARLCFLIMIS